MARNQYPYGQNSRNEFDTSIFNEVRPTYVGPPIEAYQSNINTLTNAMNVNEASSNKLNDAFSDIKVKLNRDPIGLQQVNNYQTQFNDILTKAGSNGAAGLAYINNDIQRSVNTLAKDSNIKNRMGLQATWEGQRDAAIKDAKTAVDTRRVWDQYNTYNPNYDDNSGIAGDSPYIAPVNDVDIPKVISEVAKLVVPNISPNSYISYQNADGTSSNTPNAGSMMVIETNGKIERVDQPTLVKAFKAGLSNEPNAVDYIIQENAITAHNKDNNIDPIKYVQDIKKDPAKYEALVNSIASEYADALFYKQSTSTINARELSSFTKGIGTTPNGKPLSQDTTAGLKSINDPNSINTVEKLNAAKASMESSQSNLFNALGKDGYSPIPLEKTKSLSGSMVIGDLNGIDKALEILPGLDKQKVYENIPIIKDSYINKQIGEGLENRVRSDINVNNKYDELFKTPDYPELSYFKDRGVDWNDFKDGSNITKITKALNEFEKEHGTITTGTTMPGAVMPIRTLIFKNENDRKNYYSLKSKINDFNSLNNKYTKELNSKLAQQPASSNSTATTALPIDLTGNTVVDKQTVDKFQSIFKNSSLVESMVNKLDENGVPIKPGSTEAENIKLITDSKPTITTFLTDHPIGDSPGSMYTTAQAVIGKGDKAHLETVHYYTPFGAGGLETQYYNDFVKNNPRWKAKSLINKVIRNKVATANGFSLNEYPNIKFVDKDGKTEYVINGQSVGDDQERVINEITKVDNAFNNRIDVQLIERDLRNNGIEPSKLFDIKDITKDNIAKALGVNSESLDDKKLRMIVTYLSKINQ